MTEQNTDRQSENNSKTKKQAQREQRTATEESFKRIEANKTTITQKEGTALEKKTTKQEV